MACTDQFLARWALLAYEDPNAVRMVHPTARVFIDTKTGAVAFVQHSGRLVVVAIRGTSSLRDLRMDAALKQAPFHGCMVHSGFLRQWRSLDSDGIVRAVGDAIEEAGGGNAADVAVTGHSLGAAVGVLAAVDLASALPQRFGVSPHIKLVTFGCPRVGDGALTRMFAAGLPAVFATRYVRLADPVPLLPPLMPSYQHPEPHTLAFDESNHRVRGPVMSPAKRWVWLAVRVVAMCLGLAPEPFADHAMQLYLECTNHAVGGTPPPASDDTWLRMPLMHSSST